MIGPMMHRPRSSPVLVGRQSEMTSVRQALAERGSIVLIRGEPGIGKSRLARESAVIASSDGYLVLTGYCLGPSGAPMAAITAALRQQTRLLDDAARAQLFAGPARLAAHLFPELAGSRARTTTGALARTEHVAAAISVVLQRLAGERPVLMVLEDLHDADADTADLAIALAHRARSVPFTLLVTARSEGADQDRLGATIATLTELPGATEIHLQALAAHEAGEMIAALAHETIEDDLASSIIERSHGVPLFIEELYEASTASRAADDGRMSAPSTDLPAAITDAVLSRVRTIDPAAVRVLRLAAVAGEHIDRRLIATAAHVPVAQVDRTLALGVGAYLLIARESADGVDWSFRHEIIREALLGELHANEYRKTHADVAAALRSRYKDDPGPVAARISQHYIAADEPCEALSFALEAARHARHRGAAHETSMQFQQALRLARECGSDPLPILLEAAHASFPLRTGNNQTSRFAREAQRVAARRGDRLAEARALLCIARAEWRTNGRVNEAVAYGDQALALCAGHDDHLESDVLAALLNWKLILTRNEDASLTAHAFALARASRNHSALSGLERRAGVAAASAEDADAAFMRAATEARAAGDAIAETAALAEGAAVLFTHNRHRRARQLALEALEASELVADERPFVLGLLAHMAALSGEYTAAMQWLAEVPDDADTMTLTNANFTRAEIAVRQGDASAARRAAFARDELERWPAEHQHALRVQVAFDPAAARPAAEAMIAGQWPPGPIKWSVAFRPSPVLFVARALRQAGEVTLMRELANLVLTASDRVSDAAGPRIALGSATTGAEAIFVEVLRGLVALADCDYEAAQTALARAARDLAAVPFPAHQVEAMIELAEAQASAGHRTKAAITLAEAHRLASDMTAWALVERAIDVGRSLGLRIGSRPRHRSSAPALTDRELEIATFVSEGYSNAEIAQRCFISPRTAANHVSNILSKLEFRNRSEIARWAAENGLLGRQSEEVGAARNPSVFRVVGGSANP